VLGQEVISFMFLPYSLLRYSVYVIYISWLFEVNLISNLCPPPSLIMTTV